MDVYPAKIMFLNRYWFLIIFKGRYMHFDVNCAKIAIKRIKKSRQNDFEKWNTKCPV